MSDDLPRHLTPGLVEQYADESDTMLEFQRNCRVGRNKAKRLAYQFGVKDDLRMASV
jgi:hypothetical protein